MAYRTISGRDLDPGLIAAWDALHRADGPHSPYLSPWFTAAVAAARDDVFVTLIEQDGRLAGVFPYQRQGRYGLPVGAPLNDCQGVLATAEANWTPRALLAAAGLRTWRFDHLVAGQGAFAGAIRARELSPLIDLSQGFAAWDAEISRRSKRLKKLRRARRVLGRDHGGEDAVRTEVLSQDDTALSRAISWKLEQCRRTGTYPYFDDPWTVDLVQRLFAQDADAAPGCAGALSVLYVNDEIAAVHFGIRSRRVWHWWFPSYDENWATYSPGSLLLFDVVEAVAGEDHTQTVIDLGTGESAYKDVFANADYEVAQGAASGDVAGAAEVMLRNRLTDARGWARTAPMLAPLRRIRHALRG